MELEQLQQPLPPPPPAYEKNALNSDISSLSVFCIPNGSFLRIYNVIMALKYGNHAESTPIPSGPRP